MISKIYKNHFICDIDSQCRKNTIDVQHTFKNIHATLLKYPNHYIILSILWDAHPIETWQENFTEIIKLIKQQYPTTKILLTINSWYKGQVNFINELLIDEIVFVDFFLLMTYYRLIVNTESSIATNWDYQNSNKFLFLTGKPYKINRIRLLYKFKQNNLLPHATWSLFTVNDILKSRSRSFLEELSDEEYNLFLSTYSCNPDTISLHIAPEWIYYTGIPYQLELYQNSLFQVISETDFIKPTAWITEKTWLAIINRRPFLMASGKGTLEKLKKMGFKTFENYSHVGYNGR